MIKKALVIIITFMIAFLEDVFDALLEGEEDDR